MKLVASLALVVIIVGGAGCGNSRVTTGPVGVTTRTFVDDSRMTPANGTEPAQPSRTLVTEVWYPTSMPGAEGSTLRDAPLAPGGPYPLVLFVHGSSASRLIYSYLTVGLAQSGYVVAAADFPLTAGDTPGGESDLHVSMEVGDLSFLATELAAAKAGDVLHGAVDGQHYAVVGHSTGGAVAELAAFAGDDALVTHDARVAAVVPLSGDACMFDAGFFKTRAVPVFAIGASNDLFVRFANSGQWVYDSSNAPHMLAELVGGQHMYFTDLAIDDAGLMPVPTGPTSDLATTLSMYGHAAECLPVPPPGTDAPMSVDVQQGLTVQLVRAYLDAQLLHDQSGLMQVVAAKNPLVKLQQ